MLILFFTEVKVNVDRICVADCPLTKFDRLRTGNRLPRQV